MQIYGIIMKTNVIHERKVSDDKNQSFCENKDKNKTKYKLIQ